MEDKKYQETVDIAVSKIHWGETEDQVRDWLTEEKGLPPLMADSILQKALRARALTIRTRALVVLIVSLIGVLVSAGFVYLELRSGVIYLLRTTLAGLVICVSAYWTVRSLWQLLRGQVVGAVD